MAQAAITGPYKPYRTRCVWPPNQLPEGVTETYADHPDLDNVVWGLGLLHKHGFGGMGKVFPLEMYIIEPTGAEHRVLLDGLPLQPEFTAADLPRIMQALNNPEPLPGTNEKNETEKPLNRRERRAEASRQRRAAKRDARFAHMATVRELVDMPDAIGETRQWLRRKLRERKG